MTAPPASALRSIPIAASGAAAGSRETRSTCPYCGVGCGVIIESSGAQITGVRGDPQHPANFGRLCSKGSTLHRTASPEVTAQVRLLQPLQRLQRGGVLQAVGWEAALDWASQRFAEVIQRHGPDAVGFYVSGQLLTEDYYVFNKLAKGLIGTNNIDTNSRLCMSSAVAGYKQTLGADAPPACYEDIHHAQTIFIVGSNMAYAHPVLFRRIEDAKRANPKLQVVVCDPRKTDTAEIADLHLPIQPGTDVALFNGMLHIMAWQGWLDQAFITAHTHGYEALKATVLDFTPFVVADICGITKEALLHATRLFAGMLQLDGPKRTPTLSLYCQGLNQSSSGTAKNTALINLHLATGQIGKPGAGPFSLTGQPNAMGGREVGGMANLLSGHRDLSLHAHRAEVAALWGVPEVPSKPGKTAVEMFQACADGEIKALWIACTNPAQSMPDQTTVRRALERAELVVLQEAFANTATARYADLVLPATTWGEKEGTVTNSERRISRVRAAVQPPGESRHDWNIAVQFAQRLEALGVAGRVAAPAAHSGNMPTPLSAAPLKHAAQKTPFPSTLTHAPQNTLFPYTSPEHIWLEHRESTRGRDLDITGMSYALLEQFPQQWPLPEGQTQGRVRLYEDGIFPTEDGKASFVASRYQGVAEPREARYPFSLNTGRLRDQWHGMSRTGTLGRLLSHASEATLQMNAQDMARHALKDGELVYVTSKRGSILAPVQASAELGRNQVFMAMHWGEEFLSGAASTGHRLAGVNTLTTSAFCPDSKQPEFKHAAVKVLKAELPWTLLALAWLPAARVLAARAELQALMGRFPFASCTLFSRHTPADSPQPERSGVLLRAAGHEAPPDELLHRIETILDLAQADVLRYADKKRGQRRAMRLVRGAKDSTLDGFLLAGDTRAQSWIKTLLQDELPAQAYGRALLAPSATPPVAVVSRGKAVCTCLDVTDLAIDAHLQSCRGSAAERLASLQANLRCGTQCGSCVPELQRRVRQAA